MNDELSDLIEIANNFGYDSAEFKKAFENYVAEFGHKSTSKGFWPEGDQTNGKGLSRPQKES